MGKEAQLRSLRKTEHRRSRESSVPHLSTRGALTLTAAGLTEALILAGCASNQPPQQVVLNLPEYVTQTIVQNFAVTGEYANQTDAIDLARCGPKIDVSNGQLLNVSLSFDPGSGFAVTLTPAQNVEGTVSITAEVQAVDKSNNTCFTVAKFSGKTNVDTDPSECVQTGFAGNVAQLSCDGPGTVTVEGQTTQINGGRADVAINNASHVADATVNDGHENVSTTRVAIGANCNVSGSMTYNPASNRFEAPVTCDAQANLTTDLDGSQVSVPAANTPVSVGVRGGDGATTSISAQSNGFTSRTQFTAPVFGEQGKPQVVTAGIFIREGKIILDNITCQKTVLNAPCSVNGVSIPVGQTADATVATAVLGEGGQPISIAVSDPAGRATMLSTTQPAYNPFAAIRVFMDGMEGNTLRLAITSSDDATESVADIKVSGNQQAPFTSGNWLHKIMDTLAKDDFNCEVDRVAKQQWEARCALPHQSVLWHAGNINGLNALATDSNGTSVNIPLDVYSLTASKAGIDPFVRQQDPSLAEYAVNGGGILGLGIAGLGMAGMVGLATHRMEEHAKEDNLRDAIALLRIPYSDGIFDSFTDKEGTYPFGQAQKSIEMFLTRNVNSMGTVIKERLQGKDTHIVEGIPGWTKDFVREIWERKKQAITLEHKPRMIQDAGVYPRPYFDATTLYKTVTGRRAKLKTELDFDRKVKRLSTEQDGMKKALAQANNEWSKVIRVTWLSELNKFLGEFVRPRLGQSVTDLNAVVLKGDMPLFARYLLEQPNDAWIWELIHHKGGLGEPPQSYANINRENLLAIYSAHLLQTGFKEYLDIKDWLKASLHIPNREGREHVKEVVRTKYIVHDEQTNL